MAIDIEAVKQEAREQYRDYLKERDGYANNTWRPVLTEEQKRAREEEIKKHNLPF
jgi:hypothetical protein